ncbi:MAG: terpene cyclase/mutase family protein [Kiritimatiellae bacterium]|nr:terpene cyclase/mutase family protein [Kiritimatiellia bacterium]
MKNHSQDQAGQCPMSEFAASYIQNKLPDIESKQFNTHLEHCGICTDMIKDLEGIIPILERTRTSQTKDITAAVLAEIPDSEWTTENKQTSYPAVLTFPLLYRLAALFVVVACSVNIVSQLLYTDKPVLAPLISTQEVVASEKTGAINAAAAWLVSSQESNGSWDPVKWEGKKDFEVSLTGMALLALLGPDGHGIKAHSSNIDKAVDYILSGQIKTGNFGSTTSGAMYNHGIATLAVLEVYRISGKETLVEPLTKALEFICDQQLDSGGWGYRKEPDQQANTSISAWQLQALLQARTIGKWDVAPTFHKGLQWLQGLVSNDGMVGYRRVRDIPEGSSVNTLTAMGAFCLLSAGKQITGLEETNMRIKKALMLVASRPEAAVDFYQSYFIASALHAADNSNLDDALNHVQNVLVSCRVNSGSNAGTWDTVDHWSSVGGRLYTTSMAALSLQANIMPHTHL